MSDRMRGTLFAFVGLVGVSVSAETIVHDAGRDLVLNSTSANVYTNVYGGVWSYMYASGWESSNPRTLMPTTRVYESTSLDAVNQKIILERGPNFSYGGYNLPVIAVNPRNVADTGNLTASGYPAIQPGQISAHPGAAHCAVLRFTTPRAGRYAVTAKFWNQNKGVFGMTVQTNGVLTQARQAWTGSLHKGEVYDLSVPSATYKAGDCIEITIDKHQNLDSNAAGVEFKIVEEVESVVDAAAAVEANLDASTGAFSDATGSWRAEVADVRGVIGNQARTLLDTPSLRAAQGSGARGWNQKGSTPWFHVNATDGYVTETNAAGTVTLYRGAALAPHELYMHPNANRPVLLGWSPASSGVYDIGVTMRDMSYQPAGGIVDGVYVRLLQGGHELSARRISAEVSGLPQNATFFLRNVAVAAGIPLELVVDPYSGGHNADGTALTWAMVKVGEGTVYSANSALAANLQSASPSSSYMGDGASWTIGTRASNGTLTPFTTYQTTRTTTPDRSMGNTANTSPFIGSNLKGRALTPAETSGNLKIAAGRDMIVGHPGGYGVVSALRFVAPKDGVYAVKSFFMDLDGGSSASNIGDGALIQIYANGHQVKVSGILSITNQVSTAELDVPDLHLKAGDVVDFAINPNGSGQYGHTCDLTGVYAWLTYEASTNDTDRVNIDFDAATDAGTVSTYAGTGAGRYGYAGEAWDSFVVPAEPTATFTKARLATTGERAGLKLTLAHEGAPLVANAGNTLTTDVMDATALFVDGIVSSTTNDVYTFKLEGLLPGETYLLGFYSRRRTTTSVATDASTIRGNFTVDGVTDRSTHPWFSLSFGDYANLKVTANAEGVVTGSFASSSDAPAYWNGLQIEGPGFARYVPKMTIILIR